MLTPLIVVMVCMFLFGLAWHNQPSRDQERAADGKDDSNLGDTQPSTFNEASPTSGKTPSLKPTDPI